MLASSTVNPSIGSTILCGVFVFLLLRTLLRAMFGKYENPVPRKVKRGRPL